MDTADLKRLIAESGLSDRQISLRCGEREDFVRDIKQGVKPAFDSVFRLLKVLGYEVHISPMLELGCDRRIAEALATLVEHYEQNNEYERQHFIEEIKGRWPELFRVENAADPGRRRDGQGGSAGSKER